MKKYLILLHLLILLQLISYAQDRSNYTALNLQSYIPPSPNASELGKYGSIPVGTLTGIPEIGFPLYEISSGKLKLPITLSYHASGIQVSQKSTDVGLGWVVSAGGEISRTIYGAQDNGPNGYFNYTPPNYDSLTKLKNYYTMQLFSNPGYDLEPDLFVYNIGGKSGKFLYTQNKNFMTIPFDPIQIQVANSDSRINTTFQIKDDNGIIYNFLQHANTSPDWQPSEFKINTWYLTSMISSDYVDTISFEYESHPISDYITQQFYSVGGKMGCESPGVGEIPPTISDNIYSSSSPDIFQNTVSYNELQIKKINFRGGYVMFNRNTLRNDCAESTYSLDEVMIYNSSGVAIKKITFNHSYFDAADVNYPSYSNKRLKLTGFIESDANVSVKKEYKFGYDAANLPATGSYSMDYWGFYNGAYNTDLVPVTTVYANDLSSTTFLNSGVYNNNITNPNSTWTIGKANREPSATLMTAGMLKTVTYPTGGYTSFEFEPHRYSSNDYVSQNQSAGCVGSGVNKYTLKKDSCSFRYPSSSGFDFANMNQNGTTNLTINFSPTNMTNTEFGDSQTFYFTDLTDNTVQSWKHEGDITLSYSVTASVQLKVGHTYQLKSAIYGPNTITITSNISWKENTSQQVIKSGGGLRVKSIKNYTPDNSLIKEENYVYGDNDNGLAVKLFDETHFYRNYEDHAELYFTPIGGTSGNGFCKILGSRWQRRFMGISKYNSINYLGSPVLYSRVTKYEGNSTSNTGKTVFTYNIVQDGGPVTPPEFLNSGNYGAINNAWNQGELISQITYKQEGYVYSPVTKSTFEYLHLNETNISAIRLKQVKQPIYLCGQCTMCCCVDGPNCGDLNPGQGFFSFYSYPIKTGASRLSKETKIVYDQFDTTKTVTTVTAFQYQNASNLYLTERSVVSSDNVTKKIVRLKYPNDFADPVSQAMVSKNILTPTIETRNYTSKSGGSELLMSWVQNNYKMTGNLIVPDNVKSALFSNPLETRLQFNRYDSLGNILEQQKTNDVKEVYIWGYSSLYPVAKIVGASYDSARAIVNQTILNNINNNYTDAQIRVELNKLRTNLKTALVSTYTYAPLIGMTSETDPSGKTVYYEYDNLNRLRLIRDKDNNIIKRFDYQYQQQP